MIGLVLVLIGLYLGDKIVDNIEQVATSIAELKEEVSKINNCNPSNKLGEQLLRDLEPDDETLDKDE